MIEVARQVDVFRASQDTDIFSAMAGGFAYMNTYAGSPMFSALNPPQMNPKILGRNYTMSVTAQMMGLNEDFVKNALMVQSIVDTLTDDRLKVYVTYLYKVTTKVLEASYDIAISDGDGSGFKTNSTTGEVTGTVTLQELSGVMQNQTQMKTTLENLGDTLLGPAGSSIMGALYDQITTGQSNIGANVVKNVTSALKGQITNRMVGGIVKSVGIKNVAVIGAIQLAIGAIIGEFFEMAMGLDAQFGYGGEYIAQGVYGRNIYGTIEGNIFERTGTQISDFFGELYGAFTGEGFTSASEQAAFNELTAGRTEALEAAQDAISDLAAIKALDVYTELDAIRDEVIDEMSVADQVEAEVDDYINEISDGGGEENNTGGELGDTDDGYGGNEYCCVRKGTLIKGKPVEQYNVGDVVGEHVITDIRTPRLRGRRYCSINDGPFFFTDDHPIKTKNGWKSVNLYKTKRHYPELFRELGVTRLSKGDVLDSGVKVVSIATESGDSNDVVYDLSLTGTKEYNAFGVTFHSTR